MVQGLVLCLQAYPLVHTLYSASSCNRLIHLAILSVVDKMCQIHSFTAFPFALRVVDMQPKGDRDSTGSGMLSADLSQKPHVCLKQHSKLALCPSSGGQP